MVVVVVVLRGVVDVVSGRGTLTNMSSVLRKYGMHALSLSTKIIL